MRPVVLDVTLILSYQRLVDRADEHCPNRVRAEAGSILAFFFPFDAFPGCFAAIRVPGTDARPAALGALPQFRHNGR
jgi:hypothetical protein